jgi:FkbM family methyltransferase
MANLIQAISRRLGLVIYRYPPPNTIETHLRYLIRRLGINLVIDVGAHTGEYARLLRTAVSFEGWIFSFEPTRDSYNVLEKDLSGDPLWRGYNIALGNESAVKSLYLFPGGDLDSFRLPNTYGGDRFTRFGEEPSVQATQVMRLSDVFDSFPLDGTSPRGLLKIDVQGSELDVIEGALDVLPTIQAIQVEVAAKPIYEGAPILTQVLPRLFELGYEVTAMFPVSTDRDRLRVIEFDCLLCRPDPSSA